MIALRSVSSTARALLLAAMVAGCAARPLPYGHTDEALSVHPVADEQFTMPDGAVLPVRTWLPQGRPAAVILALHGFNDSRDQWALPGPVFAAQGIAVFAPDQRGFGDTAARATWPGAARLVDDADAMARTLRARYPTARLFVMGESMGGAVVMDLAARDVRPPVDGYVMLSPAVYGRAEEGVVLASALAVANGVAPGYHITSGDVPVTVHVSDNRDALLALLHNPLTIRRTQVAVLDGLVDLMDSAQAAAPHIHGPALIAYGGHDELVPPAATGVAWRKLPPGVRRAEYPNGYHLLLRDRDRATPTADIIAWMRDPGAMLPSGADIAAGSWAAVHHPGGGIEF